MAEQSLDQKNIDKVMKDLKAKDKLKQNKKAQQKEQYEQDHPEVKEQKAQDELAQARKKIAELQTKNKKYKKENNQLKNSQEKEQQSVANKEDKDAVDSVIAGQAGRFFEKDYSYPNADGDDYNFHIKMHSANVVEFAKIGTITAELVGTSNFSKVPEITMQVMEPVAYFKVIGDDVPEEFTKPEEMYKWEILIDVFSDYMEWDDTFRNQRAL